MSVVYPDYLGAVIGLFRGQATALAPGVDTYVTELATLLGNPVEYVDLVFKPTWGDHNALWVEGDGGVGGDPNKPILSQGRVRAKFFSRQFHVAMRGAWLCRYALMAPDRSSGGFRAAQTQVYSCLGASDPTPLVDEDGRRYAQFIATVLYSEVAV